MAGGLNGNDSSGWRIGVCSWALLSMVGILDVDKNLGAVDWYDLSRVGLAVLADVADTLDFVSSMPFSSFLPLGLP